MTQHGHAGMRNKTGQMTRKITVFLLKEKYFCSKKTKEWKVIHIIQPLLISEMLLTFNKFNCKSVQRRSNSVFCCTRLAVTGRVYLQKYFPSVSLFLICE